MTINTQKLLSLFDTAAQAHGWASDQGTRAQAQTALANYQRARGDLEQALDAQTAKIAEAKGQIEHLDQQNDGLRRACAALEAEKTRLRYALRWSAAALQEACRRPTIITEKDLWRIGDETRTTEENPMADRYADLRAALAAGPTPGPWWETESGVRDRGGLICHTISPQRYPGQEDRFERETIERAANKNLIAAANPEAIRALLADYDRMRDALETIAVYPHARDQEMSTAAMRKIARAALAQEQGGSDDNQD